MMVLLKILRMVAIVPTLHMMTKPYMRPLRTNLRTCVRAGRSSISRMGWKF